ncbi:cytochrome c3 family protein [Vulgatibacter incomptus]|uniref:cytochrome c3 family protein n=1 Tax=Vulgatibacter incomptus TaxID=1391653 RepID=UPI001F0B422D|nr:cytochrome c3 family protein [Vulgatibacter incomptus]
MATAIVAGVAIFVIWFWFSPKHTEVGYAPTQPVAYSHKLHAGDLGIDCRYCHVAVEKGPKASVPSADICMNCHTVVKHDSPKLALVRESYANGTPIEWIKVHKVADFAYFSHAQHVNKGVGCVECHGRVDQMETVRVSEPLSMSWCLDCHRNPGPHLRPKDQITNMGWAPEGDREQLGQELVEKYHVSPPTDCSGCHR